MSLVVLAVGGKRGQLKGAGGFEVSAVVKKNLIVSYRRHAVLRCTRDRRHATQYRRFIQAHKLSPARQSGPVQAVLIGIEWRLAATVLWDVLRRHLKGGRATRIYATTVRRKPHPAARWSTESGVVYGCDRSHGDIKIRDPVVPAGVDCGSAGMQAGAGVCTGNTTVVVRCAGAAGKSDGDNAGLLGENVNKAASQHHIGRWSA